MNAPTQSYLARGRTDADDRLVEADELLAELQLRCGGELPGTLATPELLELVRQARSLGMKMARSIRAIDGEDKINAWIEVFPHDPAEGDGCSIGVASWQTDILDGEGDAQTNRRRVEIERNTAEFTARLDAEQRLIAASATAPDLHGLAQRMQDEGIGRRWTEFVDLPRLTHRPPLHWRLLDGAKVGIEDSDRSWKAILVPLGRPDPGSAGFELHFVADQPLPKRSSNRTETDTAQFSHSIGQDLSPVMRQPIARIIANAETIRTKLAGPLAEEYSAYAADIASAGQHLLSLIEDLSDLEVVEADNFVTAPDKIDLGDVARQAIGILGMRAQEKKIVLVAPDAERKVGAVAEFRRVLQILLNLLGNAIRYSPEGSEVIVAIEQSEGVARISVKDEGPGLDEEQQGKVFEKFERLGRSGDGGSGLGLYISRRLARAMGGELALESVSGEGARFMLDLPSQN